MFHNSEFTAISERKMGSVQDSGYTEYHSVELAVNNLGYHIPWFLIQPAVEYQRRLGSY